MSRASSPLWDKGGAIDDVVQRFCVGDDPAWDRHLVHWDCIASAAHARTLARAGVLALDGLRALLDGLREIDAADRDGRFEIHPEQEDCHTAIETHLTRRLGETGQKIHTGRSRNDQVAAAMRLFMRRRALDWAQRLADFARALITRIDHEGSTPMPGYTHMQPAMPSSVGMWLHAFAEAALEQMRAAADLLDRLDCCPLGTGAGFGVPLALDREYTARLLAFSRVQRSPIDVQNSRGRMETYFVRVAVDIAGLLEKLSWDLMLFSSPPYDFFSLPAEMTTGSSIMPQKRNPDVLELIRARAGRLRGRLHELEMIVAKLPSSYHRDLQLTKEPVIRAASDGEDMLRIATRIVEKFAVHGDRLRAAMTPELYATDAALDLVRQGAPFRQAYRRIADDLAAGRFSPRTADPAPRTGAIDARVIGEITAELAGLDQRFASVNSAVERVERAAFDPPL